MLGFFNVSLGSYPYAVKFVDLLEVPTFVMPRPEGLLDLLYLYFFLVLTFIKYKNRT